MSRKKRGPTPKKPGADKGLAPEQFPGLNRLFYGDVGPHHYLLCRLRGLVLAAVGPEQMPESYDREFHVSELRVTWPSDDQDEEALHRKAFLTSESTVLLHHAAEALVRLFLAHRGRPGCPWLEASRWTAFRAELRRLRPEFRSDALGPQAMEVFYGYANRPEDHAITVVQWSDAQAALRLMLSHSLDLLLEDAGVYNATKHGLAVRAGESAMAFGSDMNSPVVSQNGRSLMHLEEADARSRRQWQTKVTWVHPEANISLAFLICRQLDNLWSVATAYYTAGGNGTIKSHAMTELQVHVAMNGPDPTTDQGVQISVPNMSMPLLYRAENGESARRDSTRQ